MKTKKNLKILRCVSLVETGRLVVHEFSSSGPPINMQINMLSLEEH